MKLIIAGGGTGGHIYPGIAVAKKFLSLDKNNKVLYVGSNSGMEKDIVPKSGIDIEYLDVGGIKGKNPFIMIKNIWKMFISIIKSWSILGEFKPDVVFGVGGYASYPTLFTSRLRGISASILEQNTVAGLANRALAVMVNRIYLAFPMTKVYFPKKKVMITGTPLRKEFLIKKNAKNEPKDKFVILVFGGSQGASKINMSVLEAIQKIGDYKNKFKFIHQTGKRDFELIKKAYEESGVDSDVFEFRDDLVTCIQEADLLVSRSGSGVCEIMAAAKPSILIPYPNSSYGHQDINADVMVKEGAAIKINNNDLTGELLLSEIVKLYVDRKKLDEMSSRAFSMAKLNATEEIVKDLTRLAEL